jgi:hypothetical protein
MDPTALFLFLTGNAPAIALAVSALFTAAHTYEEVVDDGGPIWAYLGNLVGLTVPGRVGCPGLLLFAAVQVLLAASGYLGGSAACLLALLAVRVGDCLVSHWLPWLTGHRPNPGVTTATCYAVESVVIVLTLTGQAWR